jgi:hypothetical protein
VTVAIVIYTCLGVNHQNILMLIPGCVLLLSLSSTAGLKSGCISSCDFPCCREESLAHTSLRQHSSRQPHPPGLSREPDRLRAGETGAVLRVQPHLLEPPPLWRTVDHHRHGDWPGHRRQLLSTEPDWHQQERCREEAFYFALSSQKEATVTDKGKICTHSYLL